MATDFFDRQDHARRQTTRLIVLFSLAVAAIIIGIYLVVAFGMDAYDSSRYAQLTRVAFDNQEVHVPHRGLWRPELFLGVAVGTLLVVALGSLYKISELSAGGESVALMLGGRAVDPQTTDLAERRVLNVVEEMALASGIPVPPVFILENEPSINAFAAGHQPGDAVVAVSAGALRYLTREELQGVMGHEFSHILNGDMRLNLRLIGVVNGILVLAILGYYLLRFGGMGRRSDKDSSGAAIVMLGLAMVILGYIGVFFGSLIKAAISRQREFLADASAVQFTRYPAGIAGALKKIGGLEDGSHIRDAHAAEISHMFFGEALAGSFFNLFATHPPLAERIKALEPDFDGTFPEVEPVRAMAEPEPRHARAARPAGVIPAILAGGAMPLDAGTVTRGVGAPQPEHLEGANQMIGDLPPVLLTAAREPFAAQAVIFVMLLSRDDDAVRTKQLQLLQSQIEQPLYQQMERLAGPVQSLPPTARLPLVDLSMPAIKRSSPQQYARFRQIVNALVSADGRIDLFEYCLRTVLFTYLDVHFGLKKSPSVRYRSADAVARPLAVVLSALAYVGQDRPEDIEKAFQAGAKELPDGIALLPLPECNLEKFDPALSELAQSSPNLKRQIITAVTACIAADGQVTLQESALLRVVAAALACPMPPIAASDS
jgi:Zn-dependent protease with chaperone function